MTRFAAFVLGPSGCGKSTFCATMSEHAKMIRKRVKIVNLDPGADNFSYELYVDIRDLISVDDTMENDDLSLGPNGGLIYCMNHLSQKFDWLMDKLGEEQDDFFLFDCPGQMDLFTDYEVFPSLAQFLQRQGFRVCTVNVLDVTFLLDTFKFLSGSLLSLITVTSSELPHLSLLNKMDLLSPASRKLIDKFLDPDFEMIMEEDEGEELDPWANKMPGFTTKLAHFLQSYNHIEHLPLNITKEESINTAFHTLCNLLQISEVEDIRTHDFEEPDDDD